MILNLLFNNEYFRIIELISKLFLNCWYILINFSKLSMKVINNSEKLITNQTGTEALVKKKINSEALVVKKIYSRKLMLLFKKSEFVLRFFRQFWTTWSRSIFCTKFWNDRYFRIIDDPEISVTHSLISSVQSCQQ